MLWTDKKGGAMQEDGGRGEGRVSSPRSLVVRLSDLEKKKFFGHLKIMKSEVGNDLGQF